MGCTSSSTPSSDRFEKKLQKLMTAQTKILTSIQEAREFFLGRSAFQDEKQLLADDSQRTQIEMRTLSLQSRSASRRVTLLSPTAAPSRAGTFKEHTNTSMTNTTFLKNLQGRSIIKQAEFTKYLNQIFHLQEQFETLEPRYLNIVKAYFHAPVQNSKLSFTQQQSTLDYKKQKTTSSSLKYVTASKLIEACQNNHKRLKSYFETMLHTEQKYALPDGYVVLHH